MDARQFDLHARLEGEHWWFRGRRRIVRGLARELLPPSAEATVLDVGCGTGGTLAAFQDDYRCIGMEPSPEALAHARRRFPGIVFLQGAAPDSLRNLPARPDLILALDVLEHVADDAGLLASLLEAVKPGGHLIVTVPAAPALWSVQDETYGHFRRV